MAASDASEPEPATPPPAENPCPTRALAWPPMPSTVRFFRAPVGQELRLPRLAMALGVSFGFWSGKALAIGRSGLEAVGFRVRRLPVGFCLRFFVFL